MSTRGAMALWLALALPVLGACEDGVSWSGAEKDNASHLFRSLESASLAAQEANQLEPGWEPGSEEVAPVLNHLNNAITQALLVQESVLVKAHPELRQRFRSEYLPALRQLRNYYREGEYRSPYHPAERLGDFTEWFWGHQHEFRWWRGYEEDMDLIE